MVTDKTVRTFKVAAHPGGGSFTMLTISLEILFSEQLLPDIFNLSLRL